MGVLCDEDEAPPNIRAKEPLSLSLSAAQQHVFGRHTLAERDFLTPGRT